MNFKIFDVVLITSNELRNILILCSSIDTWKHLLNVRTSIDGEIVLTIVFSIGYTRRINLTAAQSLQKASPRPCYAAPILSD